MKPLGITVIAVPVYGETGQPPVALMVVVDPNGRHHVRDLIRG